MTSDSSVDVGEKIVVGIDGSYGSRRALDWAVAHGRPTDSLEVIHTWSLPPMTAEAGAALDPDLFAASGEAILQRELTAMRDQHGHLPAMSGLSIQGHPGSTLIRCSKDADLLVVGTRGHGGFVGLLLGSTSTYLAHHATCPLVIVPAPHDHSAPAEKE